MESVDIGDKTRDSKAKKPTLLEKLFATDGDVRNGRLAKHIDERSRVDSDKWGNIKMIMDSIFGTGLSDSLSVDSLSFNLYEISLLMDYHYLV